MPPLCGGDASINLSDDLGIYPYYIEPSFTPNDVRSTQA